MRTRYRRSIIGLLTVLLAVTACGGASTGDTGASGPGSTLRFGMTVAPSGLDPHVTPTVVGQSMYVFPLYDRLTQIVTGPEVAPMVAQEWTFTPDSRSVTFTLRSDVTFHDGTPVDAEAVAKSLDRARLLPGSTVKSYLSMVSAVTAVDARTLRIDANRPAGDLPYVLASSVGSIINPASLDRPGLDRVPDGSGPFVVSSVRLGDGVTYERAPGYWDPAAGTLATLEIIGMTNDNARLSALRSGQIDAMAAKVGQYDQTSRLGDGFRLHSFPAAATYAVWLNTARPPLDRAEVRQALNFAIDRDALDQAVLAGQCAPNGQPLTEVYRGSGYVDAPPVAYTRDVPKAKELLAQAGLPDGFEIRMLTGAGLSPQDKIAPVVQAQLAEIGVRVVIDPQDSVQVNSMWGKGTKYDAYLQNRTAGPTGAITLRDTYLLPSRFPGPVPPGFADSVNAAFTASLSPQQVDETVRTASTIAIEQAMDVFLCAVPTQAAYSDRVTGMETAGQADFQGIFDLRYVSVS